MLEFFDELVGDDEVDGPGDSVVDGEVAPVVGGIEGVNAEDLPFEDVNGVETVERALEESHVGSSHIEF